jgi:hypothetical protein
MKRILTFCNDNHWWLIAGLLIAGMIFWTFGCQSHVESLITPQKQINRTELQNELQYIIGTAKAREEDLDRQDATKQALLDAANVIGTTGSINPSGLLNVAATIGAIGFGLNRNQKLKAITKETETKTT